MKPTHGQTTCWDTAMFSQHMRRNPRMVNLHGSRRCFLNTCDETLAWSNYMLGHGDVFSTHAIKPTHGQSTWVTAMFSQHMRRNPRMVKLHVGTRRCFLNTCDETLAWSNYMLGHGDVFSTQTFHVSATFKILIVCRLKRQMVVCSAVEPVLYIVVVPCSFLFEITILALVASIVHRYIPLWLCFLHGCVFHTAALSQNI